MKVQLYNKGYSLSRLWSTCPARAFCRWPHRPACSIRVKIIEFVRKFIFLNVNNLKIPVPWLCYCRLIFQLRPNCMFKVILFSMEKRDPNFQMASASWLDDVRFSAFWLVFKVGNQFKANVGFVLKRNLLN